MLGRVPEKKPLRSSESNQLKPNAEPTSWDQSCVGGGGKDPNEPPQPVDPSVPKNWCVHPLIVNLAVLRMLAARSILSDKL